MTKFTREQLIAHANESVKSMEFAARQTVFKTSRVAIEMDLALARIALASLEAMPVAWSCAHNMVLFNAESVAAYAKHSAIAPKPLYAAQPASLSHEEELTMLVKQLVSQLKKAKPDCKLPDMAMGYLERNGLISAEDVLR
ncbi:hypothetical protein ACFDDB_24050 [Escherichia coli]|uniref:Prophage protein n=1 Tax=Escherichia coli O139:H28 (strain E24377A / ETEC) TaxID=331111 RepID=A7ZKP6_ECO24|nr:hypothetical protein [Escherichia coli]VUX25764.1 Uncharacterised protein [Escherichia fergusonii]ABV18347.1 conserved hypothetical protein [Escherichia coli O139:H28 str. E24377A]WNT79615.1 hypothetical protein QMY50_03138 [Escherichia coli]VTX95444.1 Uncharacterised protein [Escherichia coli]HAW4999375.1 hypothetical protein [Escherichia coli]